ncbi:hypothetical protein SO802_005512 [Lithocarpus litseifolius]|uniref:Uncharacterized protein n=1 Tax=Lithocarpus litseifolius TaxID=425828 RepID=A0AAW2DLJ9_9ROSI
MDDPLKVLQALPNLMNLRLYEGCRGEQLHFEGGGFQKLKSLWLGNLRTLSKLIIEESAMPLLERLVIGPSPLLKEVPSGIYHLKNLKTLEALDLSKEFVLSMQPDEGHDFWKVKHVPSVIFRYWIRGLHCIVYKLGDPELLEILRDNS